MGELRAPYLIETFDEVESTNDTILAAGAEGAPEGTTHIARQQSRGRGRGSNSWWSPDDAGLWMTTLLRPECPRETWSGISLIGGMAVRSALHEIGATQAELYWPNDLYALDRKLCGILAEVRGQRDDAWVALGLGINIDLQPAKSRREEPSDLEGRSICLAELGAFDGGDAGDFARSLAERILAKLSSVYSRFQAGEALGSLVDESLAHRGRRVEVRQAQPPLLHGTVAGLGIRGELLVDDDDGVRHEIIAGEVTYER